MDKAIRRRRFTRMHGIVAGGVLLAVAVSIIAWGMAAKSELKINRERLTIATVTYGNFGEYISVTGNVMPSKTVLLDAGEGGKVDEIFVESGQQIKAGDLVVKLSNTSLQMNYIARESQILEQINTLRNTKILVEEKSLTLREQLLETRFALSKSKAGYERNSKLFAKNVIALAEFEPLREEYQYLVEKEKILREKVRQDSILGKYQLESIDPALKLMQKNLDYIEKSVDEMVIRAPLDGQLSSLNVEYGQSLSPGESIAQIDVWDGFRIRVGVDEHYLHRIMPGLTGTYTSGSDDYTLSVTKIFPEVSGGKFRIDMAFRDEIPPGIRRGQTLQIRLALSEETTALLVPRGGFYGETGGNWIYVLNADGNAAYRREIRIGRQNPSYYELLSGLEQGEKVIISDYSTFNNVEKLILK